MNKRVIIVIVLLVLGAAGYFMTQKSSNSALNSGSNSTGSNAFTSIQDALSRSLSLQCTFTDEKGRETKTYIKAGAVRTDFTGTKAADSGSMIFKDKKMYTWNSGTKEGFSMLVPDVKVTPSQTTAPTANKNVNPADTLAMIEKYKDSCKPGTVSDSLFTPPSDIKFNDLSNMMKDLQKTMQPTGGAMNEESVKNLMEKYGKNQ